jgi:hypothetical protein
MMSGGWSLVCLWAGCSMSHHVPARTTVRWYPSGSSSQPPCTSCLRDSASYMYLECSPNNWMPCETWAKLTACVQRPSGLHKPATDGMSQSSSLNSRQPSKLCLYAFADLTFVAGVARTNATAPDHDASAAQPRMCNVSGRPLALSRGSRRRGRGG